MKKKKSWLDTADKKTKLDTEGNLCHVSYTAFKRCSSSTYLRKPAEDSFESCEV